MLKEYKDYYDMSSIGGISTKFRNYSVYGSTNKYAAIVGRDSSQLSIYDNKLKYVDELSLSTKKIRYYRELIRYYRELKSNCKSKYYTYSLIFYSMLVFPIQGRPKYKRLYNLWQPNTLLEPNYTDHTERIVCKRNDISITLSHKRNKLYVPDHARLVKYKRRSNLTV